MVVAVMIRMPSEVKEAIDAAVLECKKGSRKFSLNDWLLEAAEAKLLTKVFFTKAKPLG